MFFSCLIYPVNPLTQPPFYPTLPYPNPLNPLYHLLGEAGARALLRKMVFSLTPCVVLMRNCVYAKNPALLDFAYPDLGEWNDTPFNSAMSHPQSYSSRPS